ncbi:hypothetical protein [Streptomyces orinoci]|uniref:Uncharacterized protein n=1 Tax=Streptomyces orinoci TaxID=67339 RepID=A0ABV3JWQ6_STRON|nr:hypothetical protein [Streptomyces orinoci]
MYLVHISLCGPMGVKLPNGVRELVMAHARPEEGVEHVVAHPHAEPHPVLGLFLRADRLRTAELRAAGVCRRAIERSPELAGWELLSAQVPLLDHCWLD